MRGTRKAAGPAALVLAGGAVPLRPEPALFDAMLEGWRRQQAAQRLTGPLIDGRARLVRRFRDFTGAWPWQWTPGRVEQWVASGGWAHSTVRSYEGALVGFLDYVCDPRYGWVAECEQQAGARPVQVCHEGNTAVHAAGYEGRPERRPLTRGELQAFLDAADDHVERAASSRRKGWLAAFRDATLFKVVYGWGLFAGRPRCWTCPTSPRTRRPLSWAPWACAMSGTARRCGAARRGGGRWPP